MRVFGSLNDSECKENIRNYVNSLSEEDFTDLRKAATPAWTSEMIRISKPIRADLADFEAVLHRTTPDIFAGYGEDEEYEFLAHIFAATNDRYLAGTSRK